MKTYSDLQGIDPYLHINIEFEKIGNPIFSVTIGDQMWHSPDVITYDNINLLSSFDISIILENKTYTLEYETAVVIKKISIDNINIIPEYNHLIDYQNDHNINTTTNCLGYNGKWTLTINRPFYQWLHQAQNQGWLLD